MMKLNIFWIFIAALFVFNTACTDDFGRINDDPNKVTDIEPGYLLTRVWMRYNGTGHEEHRGNIIMSGPISGILQCAYRTGQAFDGTNDSYNEAKMLEMYNDAIRNGVEMLYILKNDDSEDNAAKTAIGKITLQFAFQRITDLYGDIPYYEGGLGYREGIFYPKYDSQEEIYKSSVDTLKKYRDVLLETDSHPFYPANDVIFGGINDEDDRKAAWAKLANSLILRMGMRATSGDLAWAQATVEEAAAHDAGYITSFSNTDAAILPTGEIGGDWGLVVSGAGSVISNSTGYAFVGDEWLRMAQQNRDPRLFYTTAQGVVSQAFMATWTGQPEFDAFAEAARPGEPWKPVTFTGLKGGGTESYSVRGLMVTKNASGASERVFGQWNIEPDSSSTYNEYHTAAILNPETVGNRVAPIIVFGGDESYFILAEAAERGWTVPGDVRSNLETAIELSISKYPELFNLSNSPAIYLAKQSAREGVELTYNGLAQEYIASVMDKEIDLDVIWTERWKSLLTAQGSYDAFPLWNRTNLSAVDMGRAYPHTEMMNMPVYDAEAVAVKNLVFGQAVPTDEYSAEPFHNGGSTEGWRPRRINYPNTERTNNTENLESAMQRQISDYGQVGNGSHFITTYMWISKKD